MIYHSWYFSIHSNYHIFQTDGSPAISRTSDQDYDHENYHETSPINKDQRKEFISNGNSSPKSPIKESQLKPTNTEISHTSPIQSSPTNGSAEILELSKNKKFDFFFKFYFTLFFCLFR